VVHTGYRSDPAIEFTWGLILASATYRDGEQLPPIGVAANSGTDSLEKPWAFWDLGGWITGRAVWEAFGMNLIAWSQNMTPRPPKPRRNPGSKEAAVRAGHILTIHVC